MYVITVELEIDATKLDAFLPLMAQNAAASVRDEPGCRQFDVCQDPDKPARMFLYEVYDDRAAFDAHLATPHFIAFDEATTGMIISKTVRPLALLRPGAIAG